MEFKVSYTLDNEHQFWTELDDILSAPSSSHELIDELIDNSLRSYIAFTTRYKDEYLQTEYDIARCTFKLLESRLFRDNKDYVRNQIIYGLLQEDEAPTLHMISAFLLYDGKHNESTLETLNEVGGFPRILELIEKMQEDKALQVDEALHRSLLELFYEMSRIQRIRDQDLKGLSNDVSDPYHYPVIRVLLVLNEQYMVSTHDPSRPSSSHNLPNRVIKTLSKYGHAFKTFGENIILLLNRESETSPQLLILKLLYLLFTTSATYEYFYTNDLRVLVDVMIRNLLDLPYAETALRHTYLRVLYPLLAHTQLREPENHYKREELLKVLALMAGGGSGAAHFGATDDTTRRLSARCAKVSWLRDAEESGGGKAVDEVGNKLLGIGLNHKAGESSLSVVEVAAHKAKPGEQTPSLGRKGEVKIKTQGENLGLEIENGVGKSPFEN